MDIELTYLDDGSFSIDCGDEHRPLAMWLEQSWQDQSFQQQLRQSRMVALLPMTIRGIEFSAQIDADEVIIYAHGSEQAEPVDDNGDSLVALDVEAHCGYDDYIHLLDYLN
ncbi:YacL family protein [Celerinatantimonas sp. MCCC 1A17872]|uniref:YacL family protein n=1 Tax=Celerinatantimonas sp. MCCC 1A17872 TaxID=3177514 RepID=UPI0038C973D5